MDGFQSGGGGGGGFPATARMQPHVVYDDGREKDRNGTPQGGVVWSEPGAGAAGDSVAPTFLALRSNPNAYAEPPPPGEMSRKFAADVLPECQLMMRATNR